MNGSIDLASEKGIHMAFAWHSTASVFLDFWFSSFDEREVLVMIRFGSISFQG